MKRGRKRAALSVLLSVLLLFSFPVVPNVTAEDQPYILLCINGDVQAYKHGDNLRYGTNSDSVEAQQLPDGDPARGITGKVVYLAQNEREGFQLYFYENTSGGRKLRVEMTPFVNENRETLQSELLEEVYFTTLINSRYIDPVADALIPYQGGEIRTVQGENVTFYVDLRAAKTQTPGNYSAVFTVYDGEDVLQEIEVTAVVWNFALPENHYATTVCGLYNCVSGYDMTNGFLLANGVRFDDGEVIPEDVPLAEQILEGWQEVLLQHGISTYEIPRWLIDQDPKAAELTMADPRRTAVSVPLLHPYSGGYNAQALAKIGQYKDLAYQNPFLRDKLYFYPICEPRWATEADGAELIAPAQVIRSVWPGAHITAPFCIKPGMSYDATIKTMRQASDILCINQSTLYGIEQAYADFTDGRWFRTWRYQGDIQLGGFYLWRWYKSTVGIFRRAMYYQASAMNSNGILHWNIANLDLNADGSAYDVWALRDAEGIEGKVRILPESGGRNGATGNGDGLLVYAGGSIGLDVTKPVVSLRLKQVSDGMDDYDYLSLCREFLGEEQYTAFLRGVLPNYSAETPKRIFNSEGGVYDFIAWRTLEAMQTHIAMGNALSAANTEHPYGAWYTAVEPDATHDGLLIRTCPDCGAQESRSVSLHTHDYGAWTDAKEATCTEAGTQESVCSVCGAARVREAGSPIGHDWELTTCITASNCTDEGEGIFTCRRCGKQEGQWIPVDPDAHDWADFVTEPTCTQGGYTEYICMLCGAYRVGDETPPTHRWSLTEYLSMPTCVDDGEGRFTCLECGAQELQWIPPDPNAHDWGGTVVGVTCTQGGYVEYTCMRCNAYRYEELPPLGHDWQLTEYIAAPNCTDEGEGIFTCQRCGKQETQWIPPDPDAHDWADFVTEPTCTQGGYTEYYCMFCSAYRVGDETPALGHSFSAWEETTPATTETPGVQTRVCQNCRLRETRGTPRLAVPTPLSRGDANGDGVFDLKDAVTLRRYLAGGWDIPAVCAGADVNGDGKADLADVTLMSRYLAGGWGVTLQ